VRAEWCERPWRLIVPIVVVLSLGLIGSSVARHPGAEPSRRAEPAPREAADAAWAGVRATLTGVRSGEAGPAAGLTAAGAPAAAYLRGAELLGGGDPRAALVAFESVPLSELPVDLAYAPYRIQSALRPDQPNPYAQPLLEAARRNELPRLVAARVLTREGRLAEGLAAYALTDPARWTGYDLECLGLIAHHGALEPDLAPLIWRARARRGDQDPLKDGLRALVLSSDADVERRFRGSLVRDQASIEMVAKSLGRMQAARRLFLERRYADLLQDFGAQEPTRSTTELASILFLAALEQRESHAAYRWGQELKRRHPDRQLADWVSGLTSTLEAAQ
jgi:hypothetical protein